MTQPPPWQEPGAASGGSTPPPPPPGRGVPGQHSGLYGQPTGAYGQPTSASGQHSQSPHAPPGGPGPQVPYTGPHGSARGQGLSIAAFVLGLLGCLPLLSLAAVVVGIIALVKKQTLRGLAIAGIALGALWIALTVVFFASGAASEITRGFQEAFEEEVDQGAGTGVGSQSAWDLRLGDCYNDPDAEDPDLSGSEITIVECTEPHEFEVYAEVDLEGDGQTYPGDEAVLAESDARCIAQFEAFIGQAYEASDIFFTYYAPTEQSWDEIDDRTVVCIVTDGPGTVGTLRGADR